MKQRKWTADWWRSNSRENEEGSITSTTFGHKECLEKWGAAQDIERTMQIAREFIAQVEIHLRQG